MKTIHEGNLIIKPGVIYDFKEITGTVYARGAAKDAFPRLTTVGGYVDAYGAVKDAFPKLTAVGGNVYATGAVKDAFPRLTAVGGHVDAPDAAKDAFPKLTTVGGTVYARDAAKDAFPKLTTVGGTVYARGAASIKQNDPAAPALCRAALNASLDKDGLSLHDGILSKTVSKRGPVSRVIVVGQNKVSYVVERDGFFAHGKTLALARADLLFKIGKRDTSIYEEWTLKTEKPLEEMIACYRAITGACREGVELFMNGKKYGKKITVKKAIEETRGKYNSDQFAGFFK